MLFLQNEIKEAEEKSGAEREEENAALAVAEKAVQRANFATELAVIAVIAALISIILTFVDSNKPTAVPADYEAVSSKISDAAEDLQDHVKSRIDGVRGELEPSEKDAAES